MRATLALIIAATAIALTGCKGELVIVRGTVVDKTDTTVCTKNDGLRACSGGKTLHIKVKPGRTSTVNVGSGSRAYERCQVGEHYPSCH